MKRFLLSSFALFLCVGVSVAQRYTASEETEIANMYGTKTYSYILKDGSRVYDGPTTIKASFDDWRYIEVYGNEYHAHIKRNCSITANYRNDCLNGALKANHNYSLYALRETVGNNTYFSGNFLKGVPNGDFLLEHTDTEYGGNTKMEVYLKDRCAQQPAGWSSSRGVHRSESAWMESSGIQHHFNSDPPRRYNVRDVARRAYH